MARGSRWPATPRTWLAAQRGRGGRQADAQAVSFPSGLLPAHLLTCLSDPGAWGRDEG